MRLSPTPDHGRSWTIVPEGALNGFTPRITTAEEDPAGKCRSPGRLAKDALLYVTWSAAGRYAKDLRQELPTEAVQRFLLPYELGVMGQDALGPASGGIFRRSGTRTQFHTHVSLVTWFDTREHFRPFHRTDVDAADLRAEIPRGQR